MKTEKIYPGAKRLIDSLSDLGYETHTAVADLVDNSIAAKATKVEIDVDYDQEGEPYLYIADNGTGMNRKELLHAMRFGAYQEYDNNSLGKYGLGLKTASLSQCRCLTVISKAKSAQGTRPKILVAKWDMDIIEDKDDWDLALPDIKELDEYEQILIKKHLGESSGTIVIWSKLREGFSDLTSKKNIVRDEFFALLLQDMINHVSMVFHRFIEGTVKGKNRLKIFVSENEVDAWDPFCKKEPKTKDLIVETYKVQFKNKTYEVEARPYIIPREDEFSSKEAFKKAKGHKKFNDHQGFYYYRSGRLLKMGGWSEMRGNDEHTKLTRVAIDFPNELDALFSINITKMRAKIPTAIYDELQKDSAKWVTEGRKRYDKETSKTKSKPKSKSAGSVQPAFAPRDYKIGKYSISPSSSPNKLTVISTPKGSDTIKIAVSPSSPLYSILSGANSVNGDLKKIIFVLLSYIENLKADKIKAKDIPLDQLIKKVKELI